MKHILEFLNSNKNWEELLTNEPYYIKIKKDNEYILLQYTQFLSDFSYDIVKECRGSIFKKVEDNYVCVCAPFTKFFNLGEEHAAHIDWNTATVLEKVDGSLIKVWYDEVWHVSTNGTIDAYKAAASRGQYSFGELFEKAIAMSVNDFMADRSKNVTYLFELISPLAPLTVQYNTTAVYYLGAIGNNTFHEYGNSLYEPFPNCKLPKRYKLYSEEECLKAVECMTANEEGFVIVDDDFNRVKIKSPEFLKAFHFINNNQCSIKAVLKAIMEENYDDLVAYQHGEVKKFSQKVYKAYNSYFEDLNDIKIKAIEDSSKLDRKSFHEKYSNTVGYNYAMLIKSSVDKKYDIQSVYDYMTKLYTHRYNHFENVIKAYMQHN